MPTIKNTQPIIRPSFKYDNQKVANKYVPIYKSERTGTGNYQIKRPAFLAEPIAPRKLPESW
jgi:hypothetical protein